MTVAAERRRGRRAPGAPAGTTTAPPAGPAEAYALGRAGGDRPRHLATGGRHRKRGRIGAGPSGGERGDRTRRWALVGSAVVAAVTLAAGAAVVGSNRLAGPGVVAADRADFPADTDPGAVTVPGPGALAAEPGAGGAPTTALPPGAPPEARRPDRPSGAPAFVVADPAPPVEVEAPAIGVRSTLVDLHLDASGALQAPGEYGSAGWFVEGPQPGQPGPAVIAGHVDSEDGPAVFYRLGDLAAGDEVVVRRQDAEPVRFTVTAVEQYPKDAFPTASVYGPVPGPELRLITCGGTFDRAAQSYRDNVVVYAAALPA
jgi:hypothetical protein